MSGTLPEIPPRSGKNWSGSAGTAATVYKVPDQWKGMNVDIEALHANVWINFGSVITVDVDRTATNTWNSTTKVMTALTTIGFPITESNYKRFEIHPSDDTYFAVEADLTGAVWNAQLARV